MRIQCSNCQTLSEVPDNSQGKKALCPKCGKTIQIPNVLSPAENDAIGNRARDNDWEEDDDDRPRRRSRRGRPRDDDTLATIIPYKNGMALAAYYCGVFGLIPFVGAILGPLALVFGILGLIRVKERPEARGTGHAIAGIVLGTLVILGHLIFLALLLIGLANKK